VCDSGIGLPPEARSRLFRPFTQADSTTTRRFGGTGLGLSIVNGLVRRMGGEVDFESEPGRGSQFWFEADFGLPAQAEPAAPPVHEPCLSGLEVHLDLPDPREARDIAAYLAVAGARVEVAAADAALVLREAASAALAHARIEIWRDGRAVESLSRPIRYQELVRRLGMAAGLELPGPATAASTATGGSAQGAWILVAEDHPVNQQVIQRQLAQLGYRAVVAGDGTEALARLETQDFAALLADLHMPNMDGIELTRAVRQVERASRGTRRLPIIALTAAALSGERERCREAGMDSFLIKPTGMEQLREALARLVPADRGPSSPAPEQTGETMTAPPSASIDFELLLDLAGADQDFAQHLMREFLRINGPLVAELGRCVQTPPWNGPEVRARAHRLLGSARTIAATELAAALARLEGFAHEDQADSARAGWPEVERTYAEVQAFIAQRAPPTVGN
jgi:CheY-like chemotaxis protein/HPt (histidine-containing phosphotransfer) domain-containing protein